MSYSYKIANEIFQFARGSSDYETLSALSSVAWELKPLIEQDKDYPDSALGEILWYYIGLKRDADEKMAEDWARKVEKLLSNSKQ